MILAKSARTNYFVLETLSNEPSDFTSGGKQLVNHIEGFQTVSEGFLTFMINLWYKFDIKD